MIANIFPQACRNCTHILNRSHHKLLAPNLLASGCSKNGSSGSAKLHLLNNFKSKKTLFSSSVVLNSRVSGRPDEVDNQDKKRLLSTEKPLVSSGRSKPRSIMELMRWHKPTGTYLALTPSLWAVGLVTPETMQFPDLKTMTIFTAGAIVARGMGCTLNDILDRKYDRLVERTKMRPIACGDISTKEALVYLSIQSLVGLYILCLNNLAVIKLGLFSGIMIASYPLFKRFTNWPQAMLALTMNWGVPMGYAAIVGSVGLGDLTTLLPIYLGAISWTLYYDTIYAHQDKTDDMFIGVKSSALALGTSGTKKFLNLTASTMLTSLAVSGYITGQLWPYYLAIASTSLYHFKQVESLNLDDTADCWKAFDEQKYVGFVILVGILVSVALKAREGKTSGKDITQ